MSARGQDVEVAPGREPEALLHAQLGAVDLPPAPAFAAGSIAVDEGDDGGVHVDGEAVRACLVEFLVWSEP